MVLGHQRPALPRAGEGCGCMRNNKTEEIFEGYVRPGEGRKGRQEERAAKPESKILCFFWKPAVLLGGCTCMPG